MLLLCLPGLFLCSSSSSSSFSGMTDCRRRKRARSSSGAAVEELSVTLSGCFGFSRTKAIILLGSLLLYLKCFTVF